MVLLRRFVRILLILACFCSLQPLQAGDATPLGSALSRGWVEASFSGVGPSSSDVIRMTVRKTDKAPIGSLALTVPPGTMLRSSKRSKQDLVIAAVKGRINDSRPNQPESSIHLYGDKPVTYPLEVYSAEFDKDTPSSSSRFTFGTLDSRLARVLIEGKKRHLSFRSLQAAVWILTDRVDYSQADDELSLSEAEWETAEVVVEISQRTPMADVQVTAPSTDVDDAGVTLPVTVRPAGPDRTKWYWILSAGKAKRLGEKKDPETKEIRYTYKLTHPVSIEEVSQWFESSSGRLSGSPNFSSELRFHHDMPIQGGYECAYEDGTLFILNGMAIGATTPVWH